MYKILRYQYNDTPDGKDGLKKLFYTCKYGAAVGGTLGVFDLVFRSQVTKLTSKFNVLGAYIVPCVGYTAAFTAAIYMATNLRGKDDKWNYFIGALVLGGVVGIARKNISEGSQVFTIVAPLALAYKHGEQHNMNIFNPKILQEGRVYYRDLSLTKDYPKNYTKSS